MAAKELTWNAMEKPPCPMMLQCLKLSWNEASSPAGCCPATAPSAQSAAATRTLLSFRLFWRMSLPTTGAAGVRVGVGGQGGAMDGDSPSMPEPSSANADMSGTGRPAGARSWADKPPTDRSLSSWCSPCKNPPLKLGEAGESAPLPGLPPRAARKREWSAECRPSLLPAVAVEALAPLARKRDRDTESLLGGSTGPRGFAADWGVANHSLTAVAEFDTCMLDTLARLASNQRAEGRSNG